MNLQDEPSTMRRKAGAGRPPPEVGRITPSRALRMAIAQAAQEVAGLTASAAVGEDARVSLSEACETLPDHPLIALVEGPQGRFGLVVLDPQTVGALIEMQTTGRVVPRPADPRAPTRTDAVMCADFIDRLLEVFERRVDEAAIDAAPALTGYRYAIALAEARAIPMTLDDVAYRQFGADVDLGRGAKAGGIQLVLPFDKPGRRAGGPNNASAFNLALQALVMDSQAELRATLMRRRMPLAEVSAWGVGTRIEVKRAALAAVVIEDVEGRAVAEGRLGRAAGHRAIRLTIEAPARAAPPEPGALPDQASPAGAGENQAAAPPPPEAAHGPAGANARPAPPDPGPDEMAAIPRQDALSAGFGPSV